MNEIRMYVERLFQGKTLTDDVIELKEEIYGNLVARYEDYLAKGMTEAEALEKTKASMTSVDDVLASGAAAVDGGTEGLAPESVSEPAGVVTHPASAVETAAGAVPVDPASKTCATAPSNSAPALFFNKKWIIAVVMIAIVLVLGGIGFKIVEEMNDAREDRLEEQLERRQDAAAAGTDTDAGANASASRDTNSGRDASNAGNGNDEITIGSDGSIRMDGEPADDLLTAVVDAGSGELYDYVDTDLSDGKAVERAVHTLPMGKWATDMDVTRGEGMLSFAYRNVPDYDGDSIDAALTYNATALLCMIPDLQEVQITVAEADDHGESDLYVFQRSMLEKAYGVPLNGDMVNESGWKQLKEDNLYKKGFIDRAIDQAERDWR